MCLLARRPSSVNHLVECKSPIHRVSLEAVHKCLLVQCDRLLCYTQATTCGVNHDRHSSCHPRHVPARARLSAARRSRSRAALQPCRAERSRRGDQRSGVGARRSCDLLPKGRVVERVTHWEDGHVLGLEVAESDWPVQRGLLVERRRRADTSRSLPARHRTRSLSRRDIFREPEAAGLLARFMFHYALAMRGSTSRGTPWRCPIKTERGGITTPFAVRRSSWTVRSVRARRAHCRQRRPLPRYIAGPARQKKRIGQRSRRSTPFSKDFARARGSRQSGVRTRQSQRPQRGTSPSFPVGYRREHLSVRAPRSRARDARRVRIALAGGQVAGISDAKSRNRSRARRRHSTAGPVTRPRMTRFPELSGNRFPTRARSCARSESFARVRMPLLGRLPACS
jgi:hypothetical protein